MSAAQLPVRLGGARVMRRCAAGERADVLLLHGSDLVAKVYRAPGALPGGLQVLGRVRHRHVVELRDVETIDDGRVVAFLTRCRRGVLADWLAGRDRIAPGEAVTILAPLCSAVTALRSADVVHGRIDPRRVLLDDGGAPVLAGFGRAELQGPGSAARGPEAEQDLDALVRMADAVLARVRSDAADAIRSMVTAREPWEAPDALVTALFDWTAGEPLRFGTTRPDPALPDPAVPDSTRSGGARERAIPVVPARQPVRAERSRSRILHRRAPAATGAGRLGGGLSDRVAGVVDRDPVRAVRAALRTRWRAAPPRLRRLAVAGAAGAVGACLVASLVPSGPSTAEPAPSRATGAVPPSRSTPAVPSAASPTASPGSPDAVVRGIDPLPAVPILLRVREGCLRELDAECLDTVDESGSPALAADRDAVARGGDAVIPDATTIGTAREMGGAVAVDVGDTDVLLIRGPEGWRIRALTAGGAGG